MADQKVVGKTGRVTGRIGPDRLGEVMIPIRGGIEAFLARDADGGEIGEGEEIVVVERVAAREVLVTRLYEQERTE